MKWRDLYKQIKADCEVYELTPDEAIIVWNVGFNAFQSMKRNFGFQSMNRNLGDKPNKDNDNEIDLLKKQIGQAIPKIVRTSPYLLRTLLFKVLNGKPKGMTVARIEKAIRHMGYKDDTLTMKIHMAMKSSRFTKVGKDLYALKGQK